MNATAGEHILIESTDPEPEVVPGRAGALLVHLALSNRVRRARTELKLYARGYIGVREQRARYDEPEQCFALRHLDPRPVLSSHTAKTARGVALFSIGLAALLAGLAYSSVAPAITASAAAVTLVAAALAAAVFVYRTEERVQFLTRHGRVVAVTLIANAGCFRACRKLVPKVASAIREAMSRAGDDKNIGLRAEVREHYRLRDCGVLSHEECANAVKRILSRFDA